MDSAAGTARITAPRTIRAVTAAPADQPSTSRLLATAPELPKVTADSRATSRPSTSTRSGVRVVAGMAGTACRWSMVTR